MSPKQRHYYQPKATPLLIKISKYISYVSLSQDNVIVFAQINTQSVATNYPPTIYLVYKNICQTLIPKPQPPLTNQCCRFQLNVFAQLIQYNQTILQST